MEAINLIVGGASEALVETTARKYALQVTTTFDIPAAERNLFHWTDCTVEDLERFSEENSRRAAAGEPILDQYQFFVSDRAENFTRFAKAILPKEVKDTKQINIEEY